MLTALPESFSWQNAQSILNEAYQKCIIIRPIFVELMGSLQAGAYLSFCYFWAGKGTNPEWTYHTEKGFTESIFLSQYQQRKARAELIKKDWWEEKMMKVGNTPKLHFRIDKKKLDEEVILLILNKAETQPPSEPLETHYSESVTVADSRTERSIQRLPITNSSTLTAPVGKSEPVQTPTLAAGDALAKQKLEKETIREGIGEMTYLPVRCEFELSENGKGSADCRTTVANTTTDTVKQAWGDRYNSRDANRAKAKANSVYDLGLKNKRWNDQQDFKKFEVYVAEWVKTHPEIVLGGKSELSNLKGYLIALTGKIAQCTDEDDRCLAVWKNWQLEKQAFSPEFVAPAPVVVTTTIEESKARIQKSMAKFNAERAANQAAQEAEQKASQEKRWGLMSA